MGTVVTGRKRIYRNNREDDLMKRKWLVWILLAAMVLSLAGCGKSKEVKAAEELIAAIGEVSVESEEAVKAAEAAYQALSEENKKAVENYEVLTAARTALDEALLEALRQSVLGTWQMEKDLKADMVRTFNQQLDSSLGFDFADYLDSYTGVYKIEFKDDQTHRVVMDLKAMKADTDKLEAAAKQFFSDALIKSTGDNMKAQGIEGDFSTREGLEAAMGVTLDEAYQQVYGMTFDAFVDLLVNGTEPQEDKDEEEVMTGKYLVQPGKLHMSTSADEEIMEAVFAEFTVDGDTMTWTGHSGTSPLDMEYPIVFHRVG